MSASSDPNPRCGGDPMRPTMTVDTTACRHGLPPSSESKERRARLVVAQHTMGMMLAELVVGHLTRSLALTADGWHMATYAGALGLSAGGVLVRTHTRPR